MAKIDIDLKIDASPLLKDIAELRGLLKKHYKIKEKSNWGRCEVCKENVDTDVPGGNLNGNTGALAGLLRQAKRILT